MGPPKHDGALPALEERLPLILHEDEHLLVVDKPAGWNTHSPSPWAGEGVYEWLRHRRPAWSELALIHRLDKTTSGVLLLAKSPLARRSLTAQFTEGGVRKRYTLLTDRPPLTAALTVRSNLVRVGERYQSSRLHREGQAAETRFQVQERCAATARLEATPVTGKTHQIRVHASEHGFPILGDTLYGGTPYPRVCLHCRELELLHPASGKPITFSSPEDFAQDAGEKLRSAIIDPRWTNAYRICHGDADGRTGWYVDRWGDYLLAQSEQPPDAEHREWLRRLAARLNCRGIYHKRLARDPAKPAGGPLSPSLLEGEAAPNEFAVQENGLRFLIRFGEGYSVGLFLDQRENRRRWLQNQVSADFPGLVAPSGRKEVLNLFAYTCGFSVCAAKAGARVTSVDLSRKYLAWGERNFAANDLDPSAHDFVYGDAFDWLKRFAKKGRTFEGILIDPPTFSRSRDGDVFRVEKDFPRLVQAALRVLAPEGVLLVSSNAANWGAEDFVCAIDGAIAEARRPVRQKHFIAQPPDFPISAGEPAYFKSLWLRVGT